MLYSNIDNKNSIRPCYACSGPHFSQDCNDSICSQCRQNLDNHTPAKSIRRRPPNKQQHTASSHNHKNNIRSQSNGHYDPNIQLTVTTSKLDHIAKLLEDKKMAKYFKMSYKHNSSDHSGTNQYNTTHADKQKSKLHNPNDQGNEIIGQTCTSKTTESKPEDIDPQEFNGQDSNIESSSDLE